MTAEARPAGFTRLRTLEMALLLLGSGAVALAYQIIWTREFRLIFGGSTSATAAVLAVFTLGLGAGALGLGGRGDRSPNPLRLYALLEAGVAAGALASPKLLTLAHDAYLSLGGEQTLGPLLGTLLRLFLAGLVLAVPTVLMGGTLPAAVAAIGSNADPARLRVAALYGANTLGAVAGALGATFVSLERFGTQGTLLAAVGLNVFVAALAYTRSRGLGRADQPGGEPTLPAVATSTEPAASRRFVLAAAFVTGFVFFLMELVWYRMLSPILGGTVFTFGLILAIVLFGMGVGGGAFSLAGLPARAITRRLFAWTCLLEGVLILLPFAVGDPIAVLAASLRGWSVFGFWGAAAGWAVVAGIVALPASIVAGFQFPLVIALLGRGRESVGRDTASAYVWNMAGGITGSLVGGFGALPLLSAPGTWRLAGASLIALSVVGTLDSKGSRRSLILLLSALALLPAFAPGPSAAWRHSQIGVGRSRVESMTTKTELATWLAMNRRWLLWEADGVESSVALRVGRGVAFVVNGKIDGHATLDAPTQVMSGILPALLHPGPRTGMVIGLGTGGTAGWLAAVPGIERVDVAELEPHIVEVARELRAVNEDVLSNPKVAIHFGDAREFLQTTRSRYDVVISEPSNPYRAGIASLFSREYYAQVKTRLNHGGLFVQWLQTYAVDLASVRRVFATLLSEFPHVVVFRTHLDLLLVASADPLTVGEDVLRRRIAEPPYARALLAGWKVVGMEGFLAHYVGGLRLAQDIASRADSLVTDDRNLLEFGFARSLGRTDLLPVLDLRRLAEAQDDALLPGLSRETSSSGDLGEWLAEVYDDPRAGPHLAEDAVIRFEARRLLGEGRLLEGYARWRAQSGGPVTVRQKLFLAEAQAEARDPRALKSIEDFSSESAGEAAAVSARYHLRNGEGVKASAAARAALESMRTSPWGETGIMDRFLDILPAVAGADRTALSSLGALLSEPFAGGALYEERMSAWLTLSLMPGSDLDCREPLRYFEKGPPPSESYYQSRVYCAIQRDPAALPQARLDLERVRASLPEPLSPG